MFLAFCPPIKIDSNMGNCYFDLMGTFFQSDSFEAGN
jgi:hypothetical protein